MDAAVAKSICVLVAMSMRSKCGHPYEPGDQFCTTYDNSTCSIQQCALRRTMFYDNMLISLNEIRMRNRAAYIRGVDEFFADHVDDPEWYYREFFNKFLWFLARLR
jgi:hypothetical protein